MHAGHKIGFFLHLAPPRFLQSPVTVKSFNPIKSGSQWGDAPKHNRDFCNRNWISGPKPLCWADWRGTWPRVSIPMPEIVLTTLNAKYIHAAFGLRYLLANLGRLQPSACIVEFDINQRINDMAEVLLARARRFIGLGGYIGNVTQTNELVATLNRLR